LPRTAAIHPERIAIVHGDRRVTYRTFHERVRRLASALAARGVGEGDTVSVVLPNVPAMLEAHDAVPSLGAVLNAINTRLDARTTAYTVTKGGPGPVTPDRGSGGRGGPPPANRARRPLVTDVDAPLYRGPGARLGKID